MKILNEKPPVNERTQLHKGKTIPHGKYPPNNILYATTLTSRNKSYKPTRTHSLTKFI